MRRLLAVLVCLTLSAPVLAQTFPERSDPHVIDLGEMLTEQAEGTLRSQLEALMTEDSTEMAVVTLPSIAEYAGVMTVEEYANALLDNWALGDAARNDGILLVIFAEDRELWLALGAGYDGAWNGLTAGIIQYRILPAFRDGDPGFGISAGIDAVRAMIVTPFRADQPAPEPITAEAPAAASSDSGAEAEGGSNTILYVLGGIVAAIAGLIGLSAKRRKERLAGMTCPACGSKGMEERYETTKEPTEEAEGERVKITSCPACGHEDREVSTLPKRSPKEPEGGKSGGGGAGGSW